MLLLTTSEPQVLKGQTLALADLIFFNATKGHIAPGFGKTEDADYGEARD